MIIEIMVNLCNLLYTNLNDKENLWKGVIRAEEVVKFLPYNKYYMFIRALISIVKS